MDYTPCGGWLGLDAVHTTADLCRGAVFGTLCPLRECLDLLEELTGRREEIVFQALACREKPVRETAGVLFRRQKAFLPENSEASLLGAAILGFTALSRFPDVPAAVSAMVRKKEEPFSADSAAEHLYRLFRERSGTVRL
jgi:sugar (pentulose or hexulose) kinase